MSWCWWAGVLGLVGECVGAVGFVVGERVGLVSRGCWVKLYQREHNLPPMFPIERFVCNFKQTIDS